MSFGIQVSLTDFNISLVYGWFTLHIHNKLICSYLCSAEQNNQTSLKNNNRWLIFVTEVDLCLSEKRFSMVSGSSVPGSMPVL